jgi:hypothetical protein
MQAKTVKIFLLLALAFFTVLMVRITVPYFSLNEDTAFLNTKQWVIDNGIWEIAFFAHVLTSVLLLFAGFTQFRNPFANAKLHRAFGKMYIIVLLFCSAPAGLIMGIYANGGITSQIAFVTLSVLWIFTTAKAYSTVRKKDFTAHGNWMIRSYALTLSAVTLRAWKFLAVLAFHPHPMDLYRIVAWLGWVPNILLAEWLIRKGIAKRLLHRKG